MTGRHQNSNDTASSMIGQSPKANHLQHLQNKQGSRVVPKRQTSSCFLHAVTQAIHLGSHQDHPRCALHLLLRWYAGLLPASAPLVVCTSCHCFTALAQNMVCCGGQVPHVHHCRCRLYRSDCIRSQADIWDSSDVRHLPGYAYTLCVVDSRCELLPTAKHLASAEATISNNKQ